MPPNSCCSAASCCDSPRSSRQRESTATASRRGCDRARPPRNRPLAAARRRGVRQPRGHAGSRGRRRGRPRQPRPPRPTARGRDDVLPDSLPHRESAMLWPLARPRRTRNVAVQERLAQARRDNPEAEAWLGLLEAALDESEDGARWEAALPSVAADRPVKAPLLCRAQVRVDGRTVRTWVRRLLDLAPQVNGGRRDMDGLALLAAAVCQDDARSDALAAAAGADAQAVRVVGQMAAVPLLQACARGLASQIPTSWWEGYCPAGAALERGYRRRERPGYALEATVVEDGGGRWRMWRS